VSDFNPDEYLKAKAALRSEAEPLRVVPQTQSFDPDAYLKAKGLDPVSKREALRLGFAQGGTLGFADEIGGAVAKLLSSKPVKLGKAAQPAADDSAELRAMKEEALAEQSAQPTMYQLTRDRMRARDKDAREQHGAEYLLGNIAGGLALPVPGGAAAAGAKTGAKLLRAMAQGGAVGAGYGLGSSEATDLKGMAADTGAGALFGLGAGAAGVGVSKGIEKAGGALRSLGNKVVGRAVEKETAAQAAKVDSAIASAQGKYGQSVSEASRNLEVLERLAQQTDNPDLAKAAREMLASPAGQRVIEQVGRAKLKTTPGSVDSMASRLAEFEAMAAGRDQSIAKATQEALADPIKKQFLPRVATLGHRMIPLAAGGIGYALGDKEGGLAGGAIGTLATLSSGKPGVILRNLVRSPAMQKKAGEALLTLVGRQPRRAPEALTPFVNAVRHTPEKLGASEVVYARSKTKKNASKSDEEPSLSAALRRR
jgi:hypothetical protein